MEIGLSLAGPHLEVHCPVLDASVWGTGGEQ